jgi:diguanylate cyclase (GGDEF)-like protein
MYRKLYSAVDRIYGPPGSSARFTLKMVLPSALALAFIVAGVCAIVLRSSHQADKFAIDRQEKLVSTVVSNMQTEVARDQESVTVWDEAVTHVKLPNNEKWLNSNLGEWMHSYFGHDAVFVLDSTTRPIFAFANGKTTDPSYYNEIDANIMELTGRMRSLLRNSEPGDVVEGARSVGVSELMVVAKHPAIVSVKPIVSASGEIPQTPDQTYLHVSVRFLDGSFLPHVSNLYLFRGLRFSWQDNAGSAESTFVLRTTTGGVIGYLIWKPFRPGSVVLSHIAPALLAVLLLVVCIVALLLTVVRARSLKLQSSEQQLKHGALHDPLTGLANRSLLAERLDAMLKFPTRSSRTIAVLYLDIDRFKHVNDTFGHSAGDELICQFAARLTALVREDDTIVRMGGDEFTILVSDLKQDRDIRSLCERIISSMSLPFEIDSNQVFVGLSIGVAFAPEHGTERTELVRKADIALYHAKSAGRGRFAVFSKEMDVVIQDRRNIERDLRTAIKQGDQIELHYQPLYSTGDYKMIGVEALLRWNHPERGLVSPLVFMSVAEESGLIETLGAWVLREACLRAVSWPLQTVAVNVSAIELRNPAYAERVREILSATGFKPQMLELEVTESALTDGAGNCECNLKTLRTLGIRISLDDFGTGFSSLERLQQLEVDRIKIDRSFVRGFGRSGKDKAIIKAIVDLAHAKGLKVTAEGVETVEQSEYLAEIGCDDLQGFLLSPPVSVADIEKMLNSGTARVSKPGKSLRRTSRPGDSCAT